MRIESVAVFNFRGLRHVEITGLSPEPVVTVSGPNGAGKSLLFEAITLLWRFTRPYPGQVDCSLLVGPWGNSCTLVLTIRFTEEERTTIEAGAREIAAPPPQVLPESLTYRASFTPADRYLALQTDSDWGAYLGNTETTHNLIPPIDYVPADRRVPRGEHAQINPALLLPQQTESFRDQIVGSFIGQRQQISLTGIQPFLASLDYLDLLAKREDRPPTGDFATISDAFFEATGKRIHPPKLEASAPTGAVLEVETSAGVRHTLDQLSSGEQEVIGLMFFVRRLSTTGGLLMIDEPELHLHPALQRSLFSVLETLAERAQVWIATHSPRLVTAAALDAILHMTPATADDSNQIQRASDEESRLRLLDALGLHPVEALQSQILVVVEGPTDAQRLSDMMPLELGRAVISQAGGAAALEATCRALDTTAGALPHICVRDRDLLTDADVAQLESELPGLFVWPNRCLENELLDPQLLQRTLHAAGVTTTVENITADLRRLADEQTEEILAALVRQELMQAHGYEVPGSLSATDRLRTYIEQVHAASAAQLEEFDQTAERISAGFPEQWERDWYKLMDGKRVIRQYAGLTPFKNFQYLFGAICATVARERDILPLGVASLRRRLHQLMATTIEAHA